MRAANDSVQFDRHDALLSLNSMLTTIGSKSSRPGTIGRPRNFAGVMPPAGNLTSFSDAS
jgi:hypothetical protein